MRKAVTAFDAKPAAWRKFGKMNGTYPKQRSICQFWGRSFLMKFSRSSWMRTFQMRMMNLKLALVSTRSCTTMVKSDCPTRWHCLLLMLESLQNAKSSVAQLLSNIDSEMHIRKTWDRSSELVTLLQSFKRTVEILSQEKNYCSLNTALLLRSEMNLSLTAIF